MADSGFKVVIVGAGPAGMVLAFILAKKGISVTLLEGCGDFNRDFRGDTLHASSLEILQQLGLADDLLPLCHGHIDKMQFQLASGTMTLADFGLLETNYNFVGLMPQEKFLDHLLQKASRFPGFNCVMNARVHALRYQGEKTCGVEYQLAGETISLDADLVIGADGRGSVIRREAKLELHKTTPPMDVLWFRLPRDRSKHSEDAAIAQFGPDGTLLVRLARDHEWQMGFVLMKGTYKQLREQGMEKFHNRIRTMLPEMKDAVTSLTGWSQCAILSVVCGRVKQWYRPGLLLIGDAAHIMSPVGGVGINYAIQDAVTAANILTGPILSGNVTELDLQRVQQRREPAVRFIQFIQTLIQKNIIANALKSDRPFTPPRVLRMLAGFSQFRRFFAYVLAYGLRPEHLKIDE